MTKLNLVLIDTLSHTSESVVSASVFAGLWSVGMLVT